MNDVPTSPDDDNDISAIGRAMLGGNTSSEPGSSEIQGPWLPPSPEELQESLPGHDILKMLGRGGMGAVYMGRQRSLDRPVAIKILSGALAEAEGDYSFAERFKNEARAMAKLSHPGIISIFDFGETPDGLLYIVMEYIDGTDVSRMIAAEGRLHTEHAMAITAHVCDALAYAHSEGIIHRDIKPANIMVGYNGVVKVADFGLAKVRMPDGQSAGLTLSGIAMGTMHFIAPEALAGESVVDHRADLYAVGAMLYQMLTGKLPHGLFELPSMQIPGLDPRYDKIVALAMRENREERYQNAGALRSDLDAILTQPVPKVEADDVVAPPALPTMARPQRPGRRSAKTGAPAKVVSGKKTFGKRGLAAALLVFAVGGSAAWFFHGKTPSASETVIDGLDEAEKSRSLSEEGIKIIGQTTTWRKLFEDGEGLTDNRNIVDGWIQPHRMDGDKPESGDFLHLKKFTGRNLGIRARFKVEDPAKSSPSTLRIRVNGDRLLHYGVASFQVGQTKLTATEPGSGPAGDLKTGIVWNDLAITPGAEIRGPGTEFTLEIVVVGDRIFGKIDGQPIGPVTSRLHADGYIGICSPHPFRDIEVLELDGVPEEEALMIAGIPDEIAPAPVPPDDYDPAAARKIADWTFTGKGYVNVRLPGQPQTIRCDNAAELPAGEWTLERVAQGGSTQLKQPTPFPWELLEKVPTLVCFEINQKDPIGRRHIEAVFRLPALDTLGIGNSTMEPGAFAAMPPSERLTFLRLPSIPGDPKANLERIARAYPNLEYLSGDLPGFRLAAETFPDGGGFFQKLVILRAAGAFDGVLADRLAALPALRALHIVNYGGGLSTLDPEALVKLQSLALIDLDNLQPISSAIPSLLRMPSLEDIRLVRTGLVSSQIADFGTLPKLKRLRLAENPGITDEAVPVLATIKSLEEVTLTNTGVTQAGADALRTALPKCKVVHEGSASADTSENAPQTKTTPLTWTDNQGRTIEGRFVRMDGEQVVLDIEGKVTPVALLTLSAASREQATRLSASSPPAIQAEELVDRDFMFLWKIGSNTGSDPDLRLLPDGRISRFDDRNHRNEATWELREGTLVFKHEDGHDATIFDTFRKVDGLWEIEGPFLLKPDIRHVLKERPGGGGETVKRPDIDSSALVAATKDKPFTNSLGMKFVPVPGTGVLFCIHETRYRDYAAFAAENPGIDGTWKNQAYGGYAITEWAEDHPVANVNQNDAKAFCQWLGEREGLKFRLPTDREWSLAVGLGREEKPSPHDTPDSLHHKSAPGFPWGGDWPPRKMDGNYSDRSRKERAPRADAGYLDHNDRFPTTAPVMRFSPNRLGLFDMGGNLWEWVEDRYWDRENLNRTLRGGAWDSGTENAIRSSCRYGERAEVRHNFFGFRVVIELPDESSQTGSSAGVPQPIPGNPLAPETWIDTRGRSVLGTFVRIEGGNVILNIAGKLTPVPVSSLSAGSQERATSREAAKGSPALSSDPPSPTTVSGPLVHSDNFDDGVLSAAWRQEGAAWHCLGGELSTKAEFFAEGGSKGGSLWLMRELPTNFRVQFKLTQASQDETGILCEVGGRPAGPSSREVPGYQIQLESAPQKPAHFTKGGFPLPIDLQDLRSRGAALRHHVVIERRDGKTLELRDGELAIARSIDRSPITSGWLGLHFQKGAPVIDDLKVFDLDQGEPPPAEKLAADTATKQLLEGQVRGTRNQPLPEVIVRLCASDRVLVSKTDTLGRFAFRDVADGTYLLRAESRDGEIEQQILLRADGPRRTTQAIRLPSVPTYRIRWVWQTEPGNLRLSGEGTVSGEAWVSRMNDGFVMSRGCRPDKLTGAILCDFSLNYTGGKVTFGNRHGTNRIARRERLPFDAILSADQSGALTQKGYFPDSLEEGEILRQGDVFTVRNETDGTYGKVEIAEIP